MNPKTENIIVNNLEEISDIVGEIAICEDGGKPREIINEQSEHVTHCDCGTGKGSSYPWHQSTDSRNINVKLVLICISHAKHDFIGF